MLSRHEMSRYEGQRLAEEERAAVLAHVTQVSQCLTELMAAAK